MRNYDSVIAWQQDAEREFAYALEAEKRGDRDSAEFWLGIALISDETIARLKALRERAL